MLDVFGSKETSVTRTALIFSIMNGFFSTDD
jgi:hypothetical protein